MTVLPSLRGPLLLSLLFHAAVVGGVAMVAAQPSGGAAPIFLQVVLKAPDPSLPAVQRARSAAPSARDAVVAARPEFSEPLVNRQSPEAPAPTVQRILAPGTSAQPISDARVTAAPDSTPRVLEALVAGATGRSVARPSLESVDGMRSDASGVHERVESVPALSEDELRAFRQSIAVLARRYKNYPALARERGWEGVVHVRVSLSPAMHRPEVALAQSSKFPLLDQAALGMMAQAVRAIDVPEQLRGRQMGVVLPVDYRLDD